MNPSLLINSIQISLTNDVDQMSEKNPLLVPLSPFNLWMVLVKELLVEEGSNFSKPYKLLTADLAVTSCLPCNMTIFEEEKIIKEQDVSFSNLQLS